MDAQPAVAPRRECPDRGTLVAFNAGRLSDPEMEKLAEHLDTCKTCEQTLQELLRRPADTFEAKLLRFCADLSSQVKITREEASIHAPLRIATLTDNLFGTRTRTKSPAQEPKGLGPYRLEEIIGQGGMGVVYRALHTVLNRTFALKTLHAGWEKRCETLLRFRREGKVIARLVHPNIVRIYDFNEFDGVPYLSMELIEGPSLARKLCEGPMDFREAAGLVQKLAIAVGYAHSQKVVHRDLKPLNVLFTKDGTPKITDFGLAKVLDNEQDQLTHTDAVMGTPSYMAPEQASGCPAEIGPRTDIYALGAVLYEALTGTPPYLGESKLKTLDLIREGNLIAPSRYRPDIPRDLEAICMRCLAYHSYERFPTAESLAEELQLWLTDQPIRTPLRRRFRGVAKFTRRRAALLLGSLFVVSLIGTAAAVLPTSKEPTPSGPDGESASVRRELEAELDAGRPVTLVGDTGYPKWFRWRAGKDSQRTHIEKDGTFSAEIIEPYVGGLLELLPDTRHDRYKLTAQIRHDMGGYGSLVGLYVAHRTYPREPREIQFFAAVQFSAVTGLDVAVQPSVLEGFPKRNETFHMGLSLRLYTERLGSPNADAIWNEAPGPRLQARGPRKDIWDDLEVIVTPETIIAKVNKNRMELPPNKLTGDSLQEGAEQERRNQPNDPAFRNLRLEFTPRGGVGLILRPSTAASVRRVTITPLPVGQ